MGILLTLLSTAAALAGIYFGAEFAKGYDGTETGPNSTAKHQEKAVPRFVVPNIFVYPLQNGNALGGYVIVKFALLVDSSAAEAPVLPDEILLADAFYAYMFMARISAVTPDSLPEPDEMAGLFLEEANRSAGFLRFETALLQQLDIFKPDTVRRKNVQDRNISEPEAEAKPASTH